MAIVKNGQRVVTSLTSQKVYKEGDNVPDELVGVKQSGQSVKVDATTYQDVKKSDTK